LTQEQEFSSTLVLHRIAFSLLRSSL